MTEMIDWNTELRAIEREFDGLPPEVSLAEQRALKSAERRALKRSEERRAAFATRARVVFVAVLLGALYWWPYANGCGAGLAAYVGAQCMIVVGAFWGAMASWRNRLVASHTAALMLLVAGLALVAMQVLPRLGYVSITGFHATHWRCG